MDVREAIFKRYSNRNFREAAMEEVALEAFLNGLKQIPLLYKNGEFTIRFLSFGEMNEYFPDDAPNMIYAPYYLIFYGESRPDVYQNVGYLGQLAILWLTVNGYSSCWQAVEQLRQTNDKPEISRKDEDAFVGEPLPIALTFGIEDRRQGPGKPARKKALRNLMVPGSPEPDSEWRMLLEAGRQAPSEYNGQPWRFWVANEGVHLFRKGSFFFRSERHQNMSYVSLGCLLANVMTMAELRQIGLELHREGRSFESVKGLEYILSFYRTN